LSAGLIGTKKQKIIFYGKEVTKNLVQDDCRVTSKEPSGKPGVHAKPRTITEREVGARFTRTKEV